MQGSNSVVPVERVRRDSLGLVNRLRSAELQPDAANHHSGIGVDPNTVAAVGGIVQSQGSAVGQRCLRLNRCVHYCEPCQWPSDRHSGGGRCGRCCCCVRRNHRSCCRECGRRRVCRNGRGRVSGCTIAVADDPDAMGSITLRIRIRGHQQIYLCRVFKPGKAFYVEA